MDNSRSHFKPEPVDRISRPQAFRDILIVGCPLVALAVAGNIVGLDTLTGGAIINLGYVLMILLGGFLLKRQGSSWRKLGLGRPKSVPKTLLFGVLAFVGAVLVFMLAQVLVMTVVTVLGLLPDGIDQTRFNAIEGNLPFFILLIVLAWTTIAFGEEMFFRAFLITRLVDYAAIRAGAAVVTAGVVFGVVHFAEGPVGVVSNGAFGVLFGWIYLRSGRNLWITVIAHGLINTMRFGLLYFGMI